MIDPLAEFLFSGNGLNVNVNGEGQITSYWYNWDDKVIFDQTSTPISKEKAAQHFREKTELSLQYQIPYNAQGKQIADYCLYDEWLLHWMRQPVRSGVHFLSVKRR